MGLRAPAKWKKYHTGLFPWQLLAGKKRRVPHFAVLCLLLHVATRPMPGAPSRYEFQMTSATQAQDAGITRKDNYNDTEEIYQTRGSRRNICRGHICGNVEQFSPRNGY